MARSNMEKHSEAKDAMKNLNAFLKRQMDLVKEESRLIIQAEQGKLQDCKEEYNSSIGELSSLLESHREKTSSLEKLQNKGKGEDNSEVEETEVKEESFAELKRNLEVRKSLLKKQEELAKFEKQEATTSLKAEIVEMLKDLAFEKDNNTKLEETLQLLKKKSLMYKVQFEELQTGTSNTDSFTFFKNQIEKLSNQMVDLDKESIIWKENSEKNAGSIAKLSLTIMEKGKEIKILKEKVEKMVLLNKTLSNERTNLLNKLNNNC